MKRYHSVDIVTSTKYIWKTDVTRHSHVTSRPGTCMPVHVYDERSWLSGSSSFSLFEYSMGVGFMLYACVVGCKIIFFSAYPNKYLGPTKTPTTLHSINWSLANTVQFRWRWSLLTEICPREMAILIGIYPSEMVTSDMKCMPDRGVLC